MYDWDPKYNINIKKMDRQHRKWLSLVQSFFTGLQQGQSKDILINIISDLHDYTYFHFASEEQYMKRFKYKFYEDQKKMHNEFKDMLLDFEHNFRNGSMHSPVLATNSLKDWLINHIQEEDMKFGLIVKNKSQTKIKASIKSQ